MSPIRRPLVRRAQFTRLAVALFLCAAVARPQAAPPAGGAPAITLLYQNFPNPFPSATSPATCIWFDLQETTRVSLTIRDMRGGLVRRILPNAVRTSADLPAGRYGRGSSGATPGCDASYEWDGRDDDGHTVPAGVYLVRLKTSSYEAFKKILFRGR